MSGSLIAAVIGTPEFREHHSSEVTAAAPTLYAAIREHTAADARLLGPATGLRALPTLLRHPLVLGGQFARSVASVASKPMLEQMVDAGFVEIASRPGREVVLGVVGRLWSLTDSVPAPISGRAEFEAFDLPGYAKAAINFAVEAGRAERGPS